nr:immunoglobulin heavy chain junction region [Macaca mulatta]
CAKALTSPYNWNDRFDVW